MKFTRDKRLHLVLGTMFFIVLSFIFNWYVSIIATFVLSFLKEVNDRGRWLKFALTSKNKKGFFDIWDLFYSMILPLIICAIISI